MFPPKLSFQFGNGMGEKRRGICHMNKQFGIHAHEALAQIVFRTKAHRRIPREGLDGATDIMHACHLVMERGIAARDVLAQLQKDMDGVGIYLALAILEQMVSAKKIISVQHHPEERGIDSDTVDGVQNAADTLTIMVEWLMQQRDLPGMRHPFQYGGMVLKDVVIDSLLRNAALHHVSPHVAGDAIAVDIEQDLIGREVLDGCFATLMIGLPITFVAIIVDDHHVALLLLHGVEHALQEIVLQPVIAVCEIDIFARAQIQSLLPGKGKSPVLLANDADAGIVAGIVIKDGGTAVSTAVVYHIELPIPVRLRKDGIKKLR